MHILSWVVFSPDCKYIVEKDKVNQAGFFCISYTNETRLPHPIGCAYLNIWFKHIYFKSVYTMQYNFQSYKH